MDASWSKLKSVGHGKRRECWSSLQYTSKTPCEITLIKKVWARDSRKDEDWRYMLECQTKDGEFGIPLQRGWYERVSY